MNRRQLFLGAAGAVVASALPAVRIERYMPLGVDLAAGPDMTAFTLYRWQQDAIAKAMGVPARFLWCRVDELKGDRQDMEQYANWLSGQFNDVRLAS